MARPFDFAHAVDDPWSKRLVMDGDAGDAARDDRRASALAGQGADRIRTVTKEIKAKHRAR